MATRMLVDARHLEETRVAVVKGNRIEEFDFESAEHKQIKGNIYLAKVTRVEPSLQAAFVDFGGNRHGFLAFSEIHPDYYQIPQDDREALLAEEAEAAEEEARLRAEEEEEGHTPGDEYDADEESSGALAEDLAEDGVEEIDTSEKDKVATIEEGQLDGDDHSDDEEDDSDEDDSEDSDGDSNSNEDDSEDEASDDDKNQKRGRGRGRGKGRERGGRRRQGGKGGQKGRGSRSKQVDEVRAKRQALRRRYKIQDVIHRRQVLLVQVVKEERGNKGAALTSYLSLAGRYTVLMPNSSHGGGISRKINSGSDRKRLKQVVSDLALPKTMGLIVRTAGITRNKTEIKRDFDYLARLWDEIRQKTLSSTAPALVHSDSDLIKRAIRDIYNRDIEEVIVEGEEGYKSAKSFMKMLMPSHARRVKAYSDPVPLFQRYGAEDQLRAMYDPVVQLKSGGYLVINPTEALVSIDINSGRSTKEHGIEQTATATNLEAAREIARQLRLRDMAGLVVIDFIDMDYNSNVRKVEKTMKDALKNDRARIQVGRISSFGLMEMSRQRLRTGVLEATTRECPHCDGTGLVRTASSAGLSALRLIEDEAARGKGSIIALRASTEAAVYLLNTKRDELIEIEQRYGVSVQVIPEGEDEGAKMSVTSSGPRPTHAPKFEPIVDEDDSDDDPIMDEGDEDEDDDRPKKRRRRRGGRGRNKNRNRDDNDGGEGRDEDRGQQSSDDDDGEDRPKKRRRRGGRRRRKNRDEDGAPVDGETSGEAAAEPLEEATATAVPTEEASEEKPPEKKTRKRAPRKKKVDDEAAVEADTPTEAEAEEKPKRKRAPRKKKTDTDTETTSETSDAEATVEEKPKAKRKAAPRKKAAPKASSKAKTKSEPKDEVKSAPEEAPASDGTEAEKPKAGAKRGGWWQRTFGE
ncbi:MAG: Rne/Rng family ribonuclease [Erythrobacter sp.]